MNYLIDTETGNVNDEVGSAERAAQNSDVFGNLRDILLSIGFTQRLVDALGIDIEEDSSLDDVLRQIMKKDDSRILCLFDHFPQGDEQPIWWKRHHQVIWCTEVMAEDLRDVAKVAIFTLSGAETSDRSFEEPLGSNVEVAEGKADSVGEAGPNG